jgi:hypothetical protein
MEREMLLRLKELAEEATRDRPRAGARG